MNPVQYRCACPRSTHAMLPTMGQGASQSVEDAEALQPFIADVEGKPDGRAVARRLERVFRCRYERARLVQAYSRQQAGGRGYLSGWDNGDMEPTAISGLYLSPTYRTQWVMVSSTKTNNLPSTISQGSRMPNNNSLDVTFMALEQAIPDPHTCQTQTKPPLSRNLDTTPQTQPGLRPTGTSQQCPRARSTACWLALCAQRGTQGLSFRLLRLSAGHEMMAIL